MDLTEILGELRNELAHVNAAILSLEQLQKGAKRRGRPPRWMAEIRKLETPEVRAVKNTRPRHHAAT